MSSGDVSLLTNISSVSPASFLFTASSALKQILPVAAPGDAASPLAATCNSLTYYFLKLLCNS